MLEQSSFCAGPKPGEDPESSIYVVQPKPNLKFSTKTSETRDVPIDDKLVKVLKSIGPFIQAAGWYSRPQRENLRDIFLQSSRPSRSALELIAGNAFQSKGSPALHSRLQRMDAS